MRGASTTPLEAESTAARREKPLAATMRTSAWTIASKVSRTVISFTCTCDDRRHGTGRWWYGGAVKQWCHADTHRPSKQ